MYRFFALLLGLLLFVTSSSYALGPETPPAPPQEAKIVISKSPLSPPAKSILRGATVVKIATYRAVNMGFPTAIAKSFTLRRHGLSRDEDVKIAGLYSYDFGKVGTGGSFLNGPVQSTLDWSIPQDYIAEFDVLIDVSWETPLGSTIEIELGTDNFEFVDANGVAIAKDRIEFQGDLRSATLSVVGDGVPPIPKMINTLVLRGDMTFEGGVPGQIALYVSRDGKDIWGHTLQIENGHIEEVIVPAPGIEFQVGNDRLRFVADGYSFEITGDPGDLLIPEDGKLDLPPIKVKRSELKHVLSRGMQLVSFPASIGTVEGFPPPDGYSVFQKKTGGVRVEDNQKGGPTLNLPEMNSPAGGMLVYAPSGGEVSIKGFSPWTREATSVDLHVARLNLLGVPSEIEGVYLVDAFTRLEKLGRNPVIVLTLNASGKWVAVGKNWGSSTSYNDLRVPPWSAWIAYVNSPGTVFMTDFLELAVLSAASRKGDDSRAIVSAGQMIEKMLPPTEVAELEKYAPVQNVTPAGKQTTTWAGLKSAR